MSQAASQSAAAAPEKKRPLLRRIPTSLIVTLLGIALTAWLLPAFTRQWDDRQKERELKATEVSEIASATAEMLITARKVAEILDEEALDPGGDEGAAPMPDPLDETWLRRSVTIKAKLQAYFDSRDVNTALHDYETMMLSLIDIATLQRLPDRQSLRPFGLSARERREAIADLMPVTHEGARSCVDCGLYWLTIGVLRQENTFIRAVLDAHATGYSTTTHDLIHDLLP